MADATHSAHHGHHITPQRTLFATGFALLVLMVLTIGAANYMPEPLKHNSVFMNLLAIGIALLKAYLVVSIFMGVKYASKLTKLFAIGGFVWFLTMFATMIDYISRPYEPVPGWEKGNSTALPRNEKAPE
ncbi:MAG: cytochrome C oxidase subunit IV family protein [Armatimonadetes bacterium]|nr:cytochrome C oxidase subunit IV family protein [Armatimonadota bacterium]